MPTELAGQYQRLAKLPYDHESADGRQPSHVLEAPQFSELAVPHDQRDRTAGSHDPADADVDRLSEALAAGVREECDALMMNTAAYSGLRWGEIIALTVGQIDRDKRVIAVDRKVVEISGHQYSEAPKKRKVRYDLPGPGSSGYLLAERLGARIEEVAAEQEAGVNPLGLLFPSPMGKLWRASNFQRNVLARAYRAAGWRDAQGEGRWVWHSLRHVFCTTALFTWKLDPTDVSRMAGHANYRTTLDMYVGTTAGILDRARTATE